MEDHGIPVTVLELEIDMPRDVIVHLSEILPTLAMSCRRHGELFPYRNKETSSPIHTIKRIRE